MSNYSSSDVVHQAARKRVKVEQACNRCRTRKRRCGTTWPCFQCVEDGVACENMPPPSSDDPTTREQAIERMTKHLQLSTQTVQIQVQRLDDLSTRLKRFERSRHVLSPKNHDCVFGVPDNVTEYRSGSQHAALSHSAKGFTSTPAALQSTNKFIQQFCVAADQKRVPQSTQSAFIETPLSTASLGAKDQNSNPTTLSGPDMKSQTVEISDPAHNTLLRSYVRNMHVVHPIVDLKYLESISDRLWRNTKGTAAVSDERIGSPLHINGLKRKREDIMSATLGKVQDTITAHDESPRQLEDAIVRVVLALGAICLEKELSLTPKAQTLYLNGTRESDNGAKSQATRDSMFRAESNVNESDGFKGRSTLLDSLEDPRSQAYSVEDNPQKRLLRAIARTYYAEAETTLRHEYKESGLIHAQLFILAGLYEGQKGKEVNKTKWFRAAGQVAKDLLLQNNLLHPYDSPCANLSQNYRTTQRIMQTSEHDFIVLVAWSCIQLEGGLSAELSHCLSGLQKFESRIPWPYRIPGSNAYHRWLSRDSQDYGIFTGHNALVFFTSQIWLRKYLKSTQAQLASCAKTEQVSEQLCHVLRKQQSTLECWRICLPKELRWNDRDPPPGDMLTARLRATYWSVQYTTSEVYLDHLLHLESSARQAGLSWRVHPLVNSLSKDDGALPLLDAIVTMPKAEAAHCTKRYIKAAIAMSIAFDGIPHKLTSTNPLGPAHGRAQCTACIRPTAYCGRRQVESTLILVAISLAYPELVQTKDSNSLLKWAKSLLSQPASESSPCTIDLDILQGLLSAIESRWP